MKGCGGHSGLTHPQSGCVYSDYQIGQSPAGVGYTIGVSVKKPKFKFQCPLQNLRENCVCVQGKNFADCKSDCEGDSQCWGLNHVSYLDSASQQQHQVYCFIHNKNRLCSMTCGIDKIYKIESRKPIK